MDIRLLCLLGLVTLVAADSPCNLCLNNICHQKTRLLPDQTVSDPFSLAIDRPGKTFYYTDINGAVFSLNLENQTATQIPPQFLKNDILPLAVDEKTRNLYIGNGSDIVKYNPTTENTETFTTNVDIQRLQFKDKLYIHGFNKETGRTRLHTLEASGAEVVPALNRTYISDFVVDKLGDIYFTEFVGNNFKLAAGSDKMSARFLPGRMIYYLTDKNNEVYFICTDDNTVFKMNYSLGQIEKVGAGDYTVFPRYITFLFDHNNNIVIEIFHEIGKYEVFYLAPRTQRCKITEDSTIELVEVNTLP